jgi:hypothetical protein
MRSGILLLVVILALAALAALLWWRFRGSARPATPAAAVATRNHHSLRTFHYGPAATTPVTAPAPSAAVPTEAGAALTRLLPEEDLAVSEPVPTGDEQQTLPLTDQTPPDGEQASSAIDNSMPAEAPRPASIRHSVGALASLLEVQEKGAAPVAPAPASAPEAEDEPAAALFHNPLTAPAPTANDQANRAAEIALRQQRRARMSADAAAQRTALSGLFPGAGSPIPIPKPS